MVPFRWTLTTAVASIFLSVAFGKAGGQTAKDQPTLTTAELARAIARTIDAHTLRSPPGSPLEFKSATSVGNVVEMKYLVNDLRLTVSRATPRTLEPLWLATGATTRAEQHLCSKG